jgi:Tol biopolymer transport system component
MRPADVVKIASVADAQISPNGQWVAYTVSSVDEDKNLTTLWLTRWNETRSTPRALLPPGWNASTPRWSPDGNSIAFLSTHDEQDGLWVVKLDKPEPRFIAPITATNFFITYAGESFSWSPDSRRIAYISAKPEAPGGDDPRVIDRIQYKSRTSFSDNRRTHVWVVEVERPNPQQLTSGLFYDHALNFSPRGDEILFLSNHEPDPDANNNSDIFAVDLGGQTRQITLTKGCEYSPVWSPDGKSIAYTATSRETTTIDSIAEDTHLYVIPAAGGAGKELATEHDRRARNPYWSPDGRSIIYLAGDRGYTTLFRTGVDGGKVSRFSLFILDGQIAGAFDNGDSKQRSESNSPQALAQPFQITSFSFSNRSQTINRGNVSEKAYPFAMTMGDALRPSELWAGLGGLAPLAGVPGTIGGAIRMNAGTRLGEISERVHSVELLLADGRVERVDAASLRFAYRTAHLPADAIVTRAWFRVSDEGVDAERAAIAEHLAYRKATQPLELPSCGSVFKNPPGDSAGRLVEAAGLKGKVSGGAQVSELHANFIVNRGDATAADVLSLVRLARDTVRERFAVTLEPEVHTAGDWPSPPF